MGWYLIVCILMFYPFALVYVGKKHGVNTQKLALQIAWFVLCIFMSLRSLNVGVDTKYYGYIFEQLKNVPFSKVATTVTYAMKGSDWSLDMELGYRFYNKIVGCFCESEQMITFTNSMIIMFLLYRLIRKKSSNYMLSIWLYLTLGIFQTQMNVSRNAIAILICYHAFDYIQKKQWLKYMLLISLAALIHKSAVIFVPLYFVLKRPFCSTKKMVKIIALSILIGVGLLLAGPYIQGYLPAGMGRYLLAENEKMESILVGMLYVGIICFVWLMAGKKDRKSMFAVHQIGSWMFMLNLCCFGMNIGLKMAARVASLFGTYVIIFIPNLVESVSGEKRKELLVYLLVIGCGMQYILRMMINNIGGTIPYTFFW